MTQIDLLGRIFTPLVIIVIGLVFGIVLAMPARKNSIGGKIIAAGWGMGSAAAIWILVLSDYHYLISSALFTNLSDLIGNSRYLSVMFGDNRNATTLSLIGLYEVGLILGFSALSNREKKDAVSERIMERSSTTQPNPQLVVESADDITNSSEQKHDSIVSESSIISDPETSFRLAETKETDSFQKDEQTIVEAFLYGRVQKIVPQIAVIRPEGYYFEESSSLKMETARLRQLLDLLVKKNILDAELSDKLFVCRGCSSTNLHLQNLCPKCGSMQLTKHDKLEHISCGLIDTQESFRTQTGDLVCPSCNVSLRLIGTDYRRLPPVYVCSKCATQTKDLLQLMKCDSCGMVAQLSEESERYLYAYTLNKGAYERLAGGINPVEACSMHFRSLGYAVVTPAFIAGKSGTSHLFDLVVFDSSRKDSMADTLTHLEMDAMSIAVEILVASKPIELEEIRKVYDKIRDVNCGSMIFVIPCLTIRAKRYTTQFNTKVVEGRTMRDALNNPEISSFIEVSFNERGKDTVRHLLE